MSRIDVRLGKVRVIIALFHRQVLRRVERLLGLSRSRSYLRPEATPTEFQEGS